MGYSPVTSFRRLVDAAQILRSAPSEHVIAPVNKWQVLRDLTAARHAFDVTDRDLRVLQALLSFHPSDTLDAPHGLIIYPSNNAICERLHGMPCSTMRRHLAKLIDAGLMTRRDSPNGKRYTRRSVTGIHAFGFDLTPLAQRFSEIQNKAQEARIQIERLRDLRETVSLMRRDLIGLIEYHRQHGNLEPLTAHAALANRIGNDLRRKLTENELIAREQELHAAVKALHEISPEPKAIDSAELSTSPVENEQHYQNHIKERKDSEPRSEKALQRARPEASLGLVLAACPEILTYATTPVRNWRELIDLADHVRPMLGISNISWDQAKRHMGLEAAASTLAAMLQRFTQIRSPNAYLARLSTKAAAGVYSAISMLRTLQGPNHLDSASSQL